MADGYISEHMEKHYKEMERIKVVSGAVEDMENITAIRFLLVMMQAKIEDGVPNGCEKSDGDRYLYGMVQNWVFEAEGKPHKTKSLEEIIEKLVDEIEELQNDIKRSE